MTSRAKDGQKMVEDVCVCLLGKFEASYELNDKRVLKRSAGSVQME